MTRRIALELGPQTTTTECVDCRWSYVDESMTDACRIFGVAKRWNKRTGGQKRLPECIAAEQAAKEPDR
jgi:hypothetical protein